MESLEEQVTLLTHKVDALHLVIDQVNSRVSEMLSVAQAQPAEVMLNDNHHSPMILRSGLQECESALTHKDILVDPAYIDPERSGDETSLSPEVQIQRLTAQLTAAYNRIAALEEQLLANRVH